MELNATDDEQLALDIISGSMYSLNFMRDISVAIFDSTIKDITVRDFHSDWFRMCGYTNHMVPYCLGAIVGYLYCGILLAKEKWFELLPDISINAAPLDWGISDSIILSPNETNHSIKYVIRRIRNSLGHGAFTFNVPIDLDRNKDEFDFEKRITLKFHDVNPRDPSDTFDMEISIRNIAQVVKKFQGIVYKHVIGSV